MQSWWMLAGVAACGGSDPSSYAPRDPCTALAISAPAATEVERDGIAGALALWRGRGVSAFDPQPTSDAPPAAAIEIRFSTAAAAFHGIYDPASASVLINRELVDRRALAIVIAHELGHVFGLAHIAAAARLSVMNPGNLATPPTEADQGALEALWGACAPPAAGVP